MPKQGDSIAPPGSRNTQQPEIFQNKSLKKETVAMTGDGGSGAARPQTATKAGRKTGRV